MNCIYSNKEQNWNVTKRLRGCEADRLEVEVGERERERMLQSVSVCQRSRKMPEIFLDRFPFKAREPKRLWMQSWRRVEGW